MRIRRDPLDAAIAQAARDLPQAPPDAAFAARVIAAAAVVRQERASSVVALPFSWPRSLLHAAAGFALAASLIAGVFLAYGTASSGTPAYAIDPLEIAFADGSAGEGQP